VIIIAYLTYSVSGSPIAPSSPVLSVPGSPPESRNLQSSMISQTQAPPPLLLPSLTASKILARIPAELHLFDAVQGVFMLQEDKVVASVLETGEWDC